MHIINDYMPGIPRRNGTNGYFMAVLTAADEHDPDVSQAVYIGIVNCNPCDEKERAVAAQWVAFHGEKQSYERALNYFPQLREEAYRR